MKRIMILVAAMVLATAACTSGPAADSVAPSTGAATTAPATTSGAATEPGADATAQPEATATMTWDGTTCTYAGPTVVPRGAKLTVALTNTPASLSGGRQGAAFLLYKVEDDITQADFDTWSKDHPKGSDVPPWVDQLSVQIVYPAQVKDGLPLVARGLTANRLAVACGEAPEDGEAMHFGAIIETKDQ